MTKILIIEDEEDLRSVLAELLILENYEVIAAADGSSGLQLALEQRPDLIICNITLPELDGMEVLRRVRENLPLANTPFIFLSADASRQARERAFQLGASNYLAKPVTPGAVLAAMKALL